MDEDMGAGYHQSLNFNVQGTKHVFRMKKFGTHRKDFHEILYLSIFEYLSRKLMVH